MLSAREINEERMIADSSDSSEEISLMTALLLAIGAVVICFTALIVAYAHFVPREVMG